MIDDYYTKDYNHRLDFALKNGLMTQEEYDEAKFKKKKEIFKIRVETTRKMNVFVEISTFKHLPCKF